MDQSKKKNALVIIYSAHEMLDFAWYYCAYGKDYNWSVLCPPYGASDEYIIESCRNSELFSEVFVDKRNFMNSSMKDKMQLFFQMFLAFFLGKRKKMFEKIIENAIGDYTYDLVVIPCDYGILPGAFLSTAKEIPTIIMEDGGGDYAARRDSDIIRRIRDPYELIGFMLAKMGYANTAHHYKMKATKYCYKFAKRPEDMLYRDYKEIRKLNDMSCVDEDEYSRVLQKLFHTDLSSVEGDVLLFTSSFNNFIDDEGILLKETIQFFNSKLRGKTLLLKRHPRDDKEYNFDEHVRVKEIDKNLPAEILKSVVKAKECYFMFTSSVVMDYNELFPEYKILFYESLAADNKKKNYVYDYEKRFQYGLDICGVGKEHICTVSMNPKRDVEQLYEGNNK